MISKDWVLAVTHMPCNTLSDKVFRQPPQGWQLMTPLQQLNNVLRYCLEC